MLPQEVAFSVDSISVTASGGAGGDINITVHDAVKLVAAGGNADAYQSNLVKIAGEIADKMLEARRLRA